MKWPLVLLFVTDVHKMWGKSSPRLEMFKGRLACKPETRLGSFVWAKVGVYCRRGCVSIWGVVQLVLWKPVMQKRELGLNGCKLSFIKPLQERKKWRQHLKVLSEKHSSLQSIRGSVLQLPSELWEYINGPSLDCGLLENRDRASPFVVSPGDQHSAKNIITTNPTWRKE